MVLSRVGNYRLLQRQLRTKPKITSKILAWETQTAITAGRVRTTFCILGFSLPHAPFVLPFAFSLFLFHSLSLACISTRKLRRHVWTRIYNARLRTLFYHEYMSLGHLSNDRRTRMSGGEIDYESCEIILLLVTHENLCKILNTFEWMVAMTVAKRNIQEYKTLYR